MPRFTADQQELLALLPDVDADVTQARRLLFCTIDTLCVEQGG